MHLIGVFWEHFLQLVALGGTQARRFSTSVWRILREKLNLRIIRPGTFARHVLCSDSDNSLLFWLQVREVLLQTFLDDTSPGDKRLAAYLMLMGGPSQSDINKITQLLTREKNEQVKNFVASHIANILNSEELYVQEWVKSSPSATGAWNSKPQFWFSRCLPFIHCSFFWNKHLGERVADLSQALGANETQIAW